MMNTLTVKKNVNKKKKLINVLVVKNNISNKKKYFIGQKILISRGFARFLITKGSVIIDNKLNSEKINKLITFEEKRKEEKRKEMEVIKDLLEKENIFFVVTNCNDNGILFGSISIRDIIKKLIEINKIYSFIKADQINLKEIIKTYGIYNCNIYLYDNISANINIYVGNSNEHIKNLKKGNK